MDDSLIISKVKAAILNDPALSSAEINVETFKGVVQLSGFQFGYQLKAGHPRREA